MRLLVVSSWFPYPPVNGAKLRAWHLVQQLARRHEVTLLSFAEPGEAGPAERQAVERCCRELVVVPGNPHKPQQPLRWRGYFGRMPRSYAQTFSEAMARAVRDRASACDAAVALQIGTAVYFTDEACGQPLLPRVFDEVETAVIRDRWHGATTAKARLRHGLAWRKYGRYMRFLIDQLSHATTVSAPEREHLGAVGCDVSRVSVLPNAVEAEHLHVDAAKVPERLIYPGSLTYAPNLDAMRYFAADILPRIRASRPGVALQITGTVDGVPAASRPSGDGIVFTGHLPDVRPLVAGSALCVVPLREGGGTRLKILEAMALGTAVVATSKGAEGLDVTPGVDIVIADDPERFAAAGLGLLADPARAATQAAAARALIGRKYTWDHVGEQMEGVLQQARSHEARRS
jgi:glycosyltransferase involved in cell wall biosynthesis